MEGRMRPLKLELCGFGTYCKKTLIDLESLGNSGLYLICGDTGSGKSTIFDAVSYVLFGHSSGDNKNESMLRSTFAGPETETYVKLEFEHNGKNYTVKRNPAYLRKALKGDGFAKENANAYVRCNGEDAASGLTAVNEYIKDLLGLEQKQFSQIVMIAQGEFQKILFADTSKRVEIFRKLFKTEKYLKLQERLSSECSLLKDEARELNQSYENFVSSLVCEEDNPNSVLVKKIQKNDFPEEKAVQVIKEMICSDEKELDETNILENENNKKIEKNTTEISKLENQKIKINDLEQEKISLKENLKNKEILKKDFEDQKEKQKDKQNLEAELAVLNSKMDQYDVLSETQKQLEKKEKENILVQKTFNELETQIKQETQKEETLNAQLESLKNCDAEYVESENLITNISQKEQTLTLLIQKFNEYNQKNNDLLDAQKKYITVQKELEECQNTYFHCRKIFMDNQAGILAKNLQEGECCPVCGSKNHPKLAEFMDENISKEQLDELENQYKKKEELVNSANLKASNEKTGLQALFSQLQEGVKSALNKDLSEDSILETHRELGKEEKNKKDELQEAKKCFEELKNKIAKKEHIIDELQNLKISLEKNQNELTEIKEKLLNTAKDIEFMEKQISDIKSLLEFDSLESAMDHGKKLNAQIVLIEKAFAESSRKLEENEIAVSKSEARIKLMEEDIKTFTEEKYEAALLEKQKLEETKEGLQKRITNISHRIQTNSAVVEKISKILLELEEKNKKLTWMTALSKTANGNVGNGKFKILLETFVQMNFLEKVIALANKRLNIMSDGQYDLIRKEDGDDKVSFCGLEINVIDHYQGGERSVRSLSGGESFEASLALALGLSDVITNYSGGIKIDTMFIDEGFGTLDGDTLQKAFKALTSISEGNDKLIGIISHVDLLKEKIHKQIRVTKTVSEGSNVQIIS